MAAHLVKRETVQLVPRGSEGESAFVGRSVSTEMSSSMGAGIAKFNSCSIEWTVLYDEIVYVINGVFRLITNDGVIEAYKGDTIFIEKGTWLKYQGDKAEIFYAVYPGNWKDLIDNN